MSNKIAYSGWYLTESYHYAENSRDPSTQNGAMVFDCEGAVAGVGWNDFPGEIARTPGREDRASKLRHTVHAELAAILDAARDGYTTRGGTMYCTWAPCGPCALAIVEAGIRELVVHGKRMDATPERWREEVAFGLGLLAEAGVVVTRHEGDLPDAPEVLFDGRKWRP